MRRPRCDEPAARVGRVRRAVALLLAIAGALALLAGCDRSSDVSGPPFGIYTVEPTGEDLRQIAVSSVQENHVSLDPTGRRLVVTRFAQDIDGDGWARESDVESSQTVIRDLQSGSVRIVSDESDPLVIDYGAVWSPAGDRLAVASNRGGGAGSTLDIYVISDDGREVVNLTKTPGLNEWDPHWVGDRIAFNRLDPFDPDSQPALWWMAEDGSDAQQLTFPDLPPDGSGAVLGDTDPKISPDLRQIAFTRQVDGTSNGGNGNFDLLILDVATGREHPLAVGAEAELGAQWSPAGDRLVFWVIEDDAEGTQHLETMRPDGTDRRVVEHRAGGLLWEEMPIYGRPVGASGDLILFDAVLGAALEQLTPEPAARTRRHRYRYPVGFEPPLAARGRR